MKRLLIWILLVFAQTALDALPNKPVRWGKVGRAHDHILVKSGGTESSAVRRSATRAFNANAFRVHSDLHRTSYQRVQIPVGLSPEAAIAQLQSQGVEAEVDAVYAPLSVPNDPLVPNQYYLSQINLPAAWDSSTGSGVTIAIADTGVDPNQPDLAGRLVPGWNFWDNNSDTHDVYGHGTAVAGVAAATGDNGLMIAGAAYEARLMPLRVSDPDGYAMDSTITQAITYAADHGVKIINISFGPLCGSGPIKQAASYMHDQGGVVVIAEGNDGANSGCPANNNFISVSATDSNDVLADFSTYGNDVSVSAPGVNMLTTLRGGGTGSESGTSFSAPLAAGTLALVWSYNSEFSADEVRQILFDSADDRGPAGYDIRYGWGRINAGLAIVLAKARGRALYPVTLPSVKVGASSKKHFNGKQLRAAALRTREGKAVQSITLNLYNQNTLVGSYPITPGGTLTADLTSIAGISDGDTIVLKSVTVWADKTSETLLDTVICKFTPPSTPLLSFPAEITTRDNVPFVRQYSSDTETFEVIFNRQAAAGALSINPAGDAAVVSRSVNVVTPTLDMPSANVPTGNYTVTVTALDGAENRSGSTQAQVSVVAADLASVAVYPNPWDTRKHSTKPITFTSLTDPATVKLFTLSGFWVKTLDASSGRATWDLRNESGDKVASGLYFYLITNGSGAKTRGMLAVIK